MNKQMSEIVDELINKEIIQFGDFTFKKSIAISPLSSSLFIILQLIGTYFFSIFGNGALLSLTFFKFAKKF